MGRFDTIKTTIDANIKENGSQEITGQKMNSVLTEMVNATDAELTELESETSLINRNLKINGLFIKPIVDAFIDAKYKKFIINSKNVFDCFFVPVTTGTKIYVSANPAGINGLSELPTYNNDGSNQSIDISSLLVSVDYTRAASQAGGYLITITNAQSAQYIAFTINNTSNPYVCDVSKSFYVNDVDINVLIGSLATKAELENVVDDVAELTKKQDDEILFYYLENTTADTNNGIINYIGSTNDYDAVIIRVRPNVVNRFSAVIPYISFGVSYYSELPMPTSSTTSKVGYISSDKNIHGGTFYPPENTQWVAFSLQKSKSIPNEKRYGIRCEAEYDAINSADINDNVINESMGHGLVPKITREQAIYIPFYGQSLSIGWESKALTTTPKNRAYMIGNDPTSLYNPANGRELNPMVAVTRESPNVNTMQSLANLLPNNDIISCSCGQGSTCIKDLAKGTYKVIQGEYVENGVTDSTNGVTTINSDYCSFIIPVTPGKQYYITRMVGFAQYSSKPSFPASNADIYIGNGAEHYANDIYVAPTGVSYISVCCSRISFVGNKYYTIEGDINVYSKGFIIPSMVVRDRVEEKNQSLICPAIVWMQGESDTDANRPMSLLNDKDAYKEELIKMKNNMQADIMSITGQTIPPVFLCYQMAVQKERTSAITMGIVECCEENDDMILMNPTYQLPDYGLHLSSNGSRWYGEYIARALYNVIVIGKRKQGVTPIDFAIEDNKIYIKCDVPQLPLVVDTEIVQECNQYGFRVFQNDSEISVSIKLFGDTIRLECSESLNGVIEVIYAGQASENRGTGNIRDCDRWKASSLYMEDADDKGTEGSSTIIYRPSQLVGKPYPMQNWLQAFYKKIIL